MICTQAKEKEIFTNVLRRDHHWKTTKEITMRLPLVGEPDGWGREGHLLFTTLPSVLFTLLTIF